MMSSMLSGDQKVLSERKRPKETSFKAKTSRAPFLDGKAVKKLWILAIADRYNHFMGAVDKFDHLIA
jgi:hypothetical protein